MFSCRLDPSAYATVIKHNRFRVACCQCCRLTSGIVLQNSNVHWADAETAFSFPVGKVHLAAVVTCFRKICRQLKDALHASRENVSLLGLVLGMEKRQIPEPVNATLARQQ